jgi:hypothetical protein
MGIWREEDHPRGYHGHFIEKSKQIGSALVDATLAASSDIASRFKNLGKALVGTTTLVPGAVMVFVSTLNASVYRRGGDASAASRNDYNQVPVKLQDSKYLPDWLMPISLTTWQHILDGHAPESRYGNTDKFHDGTTEAIVSTILRSIPLSEPNLKNGRNQQFYAIYNELTIRMFFEYDYAYGKWILTSFHPFSGDKVNVFFKGGMN